MPSSSGFIVDQVVALVEPLTRFDRSSILLRGQSEERLRCTGIWTSSFSISARTSEGFGKLPSGVRNASSHSGMEREMGEALSAERSRAIRRIQDWCEVEAESPASSHRALRANDCMGDITRIGYEWKCSPCRGGGSITCSRCHGSCRISCSRCGGSGHMACSNCNGRGRQTCTSCGGRRGTYRQVQHRVFNTAAKEYTVRYENVWEQCTRCQGGEVQCISCHSGKVNCLTCHTHGRVSCPACNASGRQTCNACKGKGALHRIAETTCEVTNTFAMHCGGANTEVQGTIARWDFPIFCKLASISGSSPDVTASQLTRTYPATLLVTQAGVQCGGQEFRLYGYGPQARVFDFKGIVGQLLANDLQQLQATLARPAGFLALENQNDLRGSLSLMLASELNQQLCDTKQRDALLASRMVTEEQAKATVDALRKAMGRLYRAAATLGLLALVVVLLATLFCLYRFGYMAAGNRLGGVAIFAAVAAISGVAAEFTARHRLLQEFSRSGKEEEREAADRILHSTGTLSRWRIAAAVAALATIIGFFVVVTH